MTTTELRAALIARFGARKYRITATGEIHVYGQMPNSIETGWWLFGYVGDPQTKARI